jgi:hypothetical protein
MLASTQQARVRTRTRKRGPKKSQNQVVTKREVAAMIRANNKLVVETKVTYTQQSGGIDYNGSVFNLTAALNRGDQPLDEFTGDLIRPSQLVIRGTWSTNQTYTTCRFMVFQWLDASIPVPSGILYNVGSALSPESSLYWTNVHKIHVLYDEKTVIFPVAGSYAAGQFLVRLNNCFRTIQYPALGPLQPQMSGIYAIAITNDAIPTYPQLEYISELRYSDA